MRAASIVALLALTACNNRSEEVAAGDPSSSSDPVAACVAKGVAYFKEIGSYPMLTAPENRGRRAEDVALERCRRTTGAFGD